MKVKHVELYINNDLLYGVAGQGIGLWSTIIIIMGTSFQPEVFLFVTSWPFNCGS